MRRLALTVCVSLVVIGFGARVCALDARKRPSQYVSQQWSLNNGLTDTCVQALAQTPDGYLWIGTQNSGLVRFDGVRFTPMKPEFAAPGNDPSIRALAVRRDGSLWVGTDGQGLWSWREGRFERFGRESGLPSENIRGLFEDRSGTLWIACAGGLLRMNPGGAIEPVELSSANPRMLRVQPLFYKTSMFRFLFVASIALAILLLVRLRARREREKFASMLEERMRIARELHDTLEQGLVGVAMQLNLASEQSRNLAFPGQRFLERARFMLKHSMADARAAILDLRKEARPRNFLRELHRIAMEMTSDLGITLECSEKGGPGNLSGFAVTTLLRIGQEAITNIVKHARAKHVMIELAHGESGVTLTIEDDGCGFDPATLPSLEGEHFGLLGARERAEKLGGILEVQSFPLEGTRIVVTLPSNRGEVLRQLATKNVAGVR